MSDTVVVSQLGARMHYAVPKIFADEGRLAHFYTDICATKGWPRLFNLLPKAVLPAAVRRLVGRRPAGIPNELITVFPGFGLQSVLRHMKTRNVVEETSHAVWAGSTFSRMVADKGFHGAAGLYAFSGDALEQMRAARRQGLWTAVEQMIAPRGIVELLIAQEQQRFPSWTDTVLENGYAKIFESREKAEWALADFIVCPSEFVRQHVIAQGGAADRCVLVPYGVDQTMHFDRSERVPGPLRVLTVGEVGLRKGSPYVAEAARLASGVAKFRMVGRLRIPEEIQRQISQWVELKGAVPRAQMATEFRWADVFLLPSICEGSATAVFEALAAGLPVITTENTGTVVRDGVEGFLVPIGDPDAIALAIARLATDDQLRMHMSANAWRRSNDYSVGSYGKRLLSALAKPRPAEAEIEPISS